MFNTLPEEYIAQKFFEFAGYPKHNRSNNTYTGGCNTCHEGKSWKRKRRLFFIPEKDVIFCHNCGLSMRPINWIIKQTGMTYEEIIKDSEELYSSIPSYDSEEVKQPVNLYDELPVDSINLFDEQSVSYYINDNICKIALKYIKARKLDVAINKPKSLYISLKDYIHKNRLIIPFCDEKNEIVWYQSRTLLKSDDKKPKYLSKSNSEKSIFGMDRIDNSLNYVFIFEGPIDACFVKNGLAMAGLNPSEKQQEQLDSLKLYDKIWILDNELKTNKDVKGNIIHLIEKGERVFFWPDKLKDFKDINELCLKINKNNINPEFFIKNSFSGCEALLKIEN